MAKALVAGEDYATVDVLSSELSGMGYEVVLAADGQETLACVTAEAPAVVFLCENLRVFDGYETCRLLRQDPDVPAGLPIFVVSREPRNVRLLERAGATEWFPAQHDAALVREILGGLSGKSGDL